MAAAIKTIQEQNFEFWMRPENFGQVPCRTAFEMFKDNRINFTTLLENIRNETDVDESFEGLCEEVARQLFPENLPNKREDSNYFQFLEECFMGQTSEESYEEDRENERKKKEYQILKETIRMVSGMNSEIQTHQELKRKMVRMNPMIGLKIQDHPKWVTWNEYNEKEQSLYTKTFWKIYLKNEELAPLYAEETAKKMRKRRIQEEIKLEAKEQRAKKAKMMKELREAEKENKKAKTAEKRSKKVKLLELEEEEKEKEVAELMKKIFDDCNDKDYLF